MKNVFYVPVAESIPQTAGEVNISRNNKKNSCLSGSCSAFIDMQGKEHCIILFLSENRLLGRIQETLIDTLLADVLIAEINLKKLTVHFYLTVCPVIKILASELEYLVIACR